MTPWDKGYVLKELGLNPMEFFDFQLKIFDSIKFADWLEQNFNCENKTYIEVIKENFPNYYSRIMNCFFE